jgi:hypothetical protein
MRHWGGRDAVRREGDTGSGRESLPAKHHLPPRANFTSPGKPYNPYEATFRMPPVGHQDRRPFVPRHSIRRTNDIHPHGQLHRAGAPRMERRMGPAVASHIARTSVPSLGSSSHSTTR